MTSLLDLALLGLNPERVRRLLGGPHSAVRTVVSAGGVGSIQWPVDGVEFVEGEALPDRLRVLPDAPSWLFVRGHLPEGPSVAVVGSRRATRYGLEIAAEIGRRVGSAGWPVVSGLALGVDAAAHHGCLEAGGRAVAVLGSGIDVWYPRKNRALGERILVQGGAVVSEFGPGVTPEPWRFPFRNRIISGLASVVIVVEAAVRSGALITAHLAVGYDREVMAVPGDIDRSTSAGCNLLIRDGAHPITGLDDLVETIEFWLGPSPRAQVRSEPGVLGPLPATIDQIAQRRGVGTTDLMLEIMRMQSAGTITVEEGVVREATTASKTGSHDYGR